MKRFELQKLTERNNRNHSETWSKIYAWDAPEPLMQCLVEGYRIIDKETGKELARYEYGRILKRGKS